MPHPQGGSLKRKGGLRVAMVAACPFPCPRGTPVRIQRLAEFLTRRGHEVEVITYHLGFSEETLPFPVHRIPALRTYRKLSAGPTYQKLFLLDPLLAYRVWKCLSERRFDIIHAHHFEGLLAALPAKLLTNLPLIFDVHTLLESELVQYGLGLPKRVKLRVGAFLDGCLPRVADSVIAVTDTIREKLLDSGVLDPRKVTVVTNGVEFEAFQVNGRFAAEGKNGKRLVFAGNLAAYQGIDLLLKAFRRIVEMRPDARLLLLTMSSFDRYERLARELGVRQKIDVVNVEFNQLPYQLARADIALNPRVDCDGIPQKLLNYMAAGKPIVSFSSSAKTLEDGVTGVAVRDGDISAFARAAVKLLEDEKLALRLGENARRAARELYSWERSAELAEAVYERLLRKPHRRRD